MMRDAGVVWLQITGGEPTIDKDFTDAYRLAFELGMMLTVSTNGSRLWRGDLLELFTTLPPYRLVVSLYGATEAAYDGLTQRRGSYKAFRRGIAAAIEAELPVRLNIVVTDVSAAETMAMAAQAEEWGVPHNVYTNMTPTIYGSGESLLAQSAEHLRTRKAFTGCNAGPWPSSSSRRRPAPLLLPAPRQEPARRHEQEVSMTAVPVTLYPTRPAEQVPPEVTAPVMVELDQVIESTTCSCNAGDDNPPLTASRGQP